MATVVIPASEMPTGDPAIHHAWMWMNLLMRKAAKGFAQCKEMQGVQQEVFLQPEDITKTVNQVAEVVENTIVNWISRAIQWVVEKVSHWLTRLFW